MPKAGDGAGLALEPDAQIVPVGDVFGETFDSDSAVEPRVARLPHFAHAARAEGREDLMRAEEVSW
jgi:hypothetical protein